MGPGKYPFLYEKQTEMHFLLLENLTMKEYTKFGLLVKKNSEDLNHLRFCSEVVSSLWPMILGYLGEGWVRHGLWKFVQLET